VSDRRLNAVQGIVLAVLLSIPFWALVVWAVVK
jgi:hypothetical protein